MRDTQTYEVVIDTVTMMVEAWDEEHAELIAEQELNQFAWSWEGVRVR